MSPTALGIMVALRSVRLPLEDEKALQAAIGETLCRARINFTRERKIRGGVIDFLVPHPDGGRLPGCVGIEVKIKGGRRSIFRQLSAYCNEGRVAELIVATSLPLSLPPEINRKQVMVVDLGRAWL